VRRRVGLLGILAVSGCGQPPSTTSSGESESTSTSTSTAETGSGATESGESAESETGASDLPAEPERPELTSPAEAEDLDPDPDIVRVALTAAPMAYEIAGESVEGWAYNGQIPGPTIRVQRGNTLVVEFHNALPDDTTIHWHGLRVPFAMDGVTWQGEPVGPGEDFEFSFEIDQAGTYWYHPHIDSDRQVDLGLYGVIVVEDPAEPVADRELVLVLDAWGEHDDDDGELHDHGAVLEWTVNGLHDPVFPALAGERIRVRAVDVSNTGYLDLTWPDLRQIASDQGLLAALAQPDSTVLAPGDRTDFEWLIGTSFEVINQPFSLLGAPAVGEAVRLFDVDVATPGEPPAPLDWPFDGAAPTPDPGWSDIVYALHGDPHTGIWTINGEQFPDITIETLTLGEWSILELRNISQTAHPFHLHGQVFEILSMDGIAPEHRRIEDTIDVAPYSIVRLGLLPDNPGDWMAHCHILPHAHGMMTVLRVAG
jgi:FtsP/CotA-like multicopper oxidase with cupredoxin domain